MHGNASNSQSLLLHDYRIFDGIPTELKITVGLDAKTIGLLVYNAFTDAHNLATAYKDISGDLLTGVPKSIAETVEEVFRVLGTLESIDAAYKQIRDGVEARSHKPSVTDKIAAIYEDTQFHGRIEQDHVMVDIKFILPQKYRHTD